MEGFKIYDLKMYPLDTENPEVGMIGYHNNKIYIYLYGWVEIEELHEEEYEGIIRGFETYIDEEEMN